MCVTNFHDMTLAVKVALKPNITNQSFLAMGNSAAKVSFLVLKFNQSVFMFQWMALQKRGNALHKSVNFVTETRMH